MGLKELRESKGITKQELAERVGVSARTIGRYETGECKPDEERKRKLIECLAVSEQDFNGMLMAVKSGKTGEREEMEVEQKKMLCPFRTYMKRVNGGSEKRFCNCIRGECAMYKDGMCCMRDMM